MSNPWPFDPPSKDKLSLGKGCAFCHQPLESGLAYWLVKGGFMCDRCLTKSQERKE